MKMSLSLWMFKVKNLVLKLSFLWRNEYLGLFMHYILGFEGLFPFPSSFSLLSVPYLGFAVVFPSKNQSYFSHLPMLCNDYLKSFNLPCLSWSLEDSLSHRESTWKHSMGSEQFLQPDKNNFARISQSNENI